MSDLNKLQNQHEQAKALIERRDVILRLSENPDFKTVIREGFMVEDCARYVRESINPGLSAEDRASALGFAQAAGYLKQFLNVAVMQGNTAENEIRQIEEAMDEVRAEGGDE